MTNEVSIFDLPLILENIGRFLDRRDVESCTLVNKTFQDSFHRVFWQELTFGMRPTPLRTQEEMEQVQQQALIDNCKWIRKLSVHSNLRREGLLALLACHCAGVTDFTSHIVLFARNRDIGDPAFSSILELATNNVNLRRWSIYVQSDLSPLDPGPLTGVFSKKLYLTELELGLGSNPCRGWMRCVLQNLPASLKRLYLQWGFLYEDNGVEYFKDQGWPLSYPSLEEAELWIDVIEREEWALVEFLKRCPAITELTLPTMLGPQLSSVITGVLGSTESMPKLKTLDFGLNTDLSREDWELVLLAMKGRIKCFAGSLPFGTPPMRSYIPEMVTHWSSTLEEIRIGQTLCFKSCDLHTILTQCPRLKRFDCLLGRIVGPVLPYTNAWEPIPGLESVPLNEDDVEHSGRNWVCKELEVFKMMFVDGRTWSTEEEVRLQQERWTARAITYAYEQIGRLTNLKELAIGWRSNDEYTNGPNLDMSIRSGLWRLSGLKSLKTLNIAHIRRVNVGAEEVQWMNGNWPKLEMIKGLAYRFYKSGQEISLPPYLDWLQLQRPHLTFQ
ncbi:MAG: hypothetical protein J3Q66DRAFT_400666 [Benniella sp.]|nr:MAG: hypothetical protein J3Q66DRAFT_400666 [Benniella sp.]